MSRAAVSALMQWAQIAVSLVSLAGDVGASFRLHRLYSDGIVLSAAFPAVLGFAVPGAQVCCCGKRACSCTEGS